MEELILFIMSYVLIFTIYEIFIIAPLKKNKKKKNNKELLEVKYLEAKYNLDIKNIKYEQLIQICALVSSLDISIGVTLISFVQGLFLEILVCFTSVIVLIFISYHFVYLFYKKKGLIRNGKYK